MLRVFGYRGRGRVRPSAGSVDHAPGRPIRINTTPELMRAAFESRPVAWEDAHRIADMIRADYPTLPPLAPRTGVAWPLPPTARYVGEHGPELTDLPPEVGTCAEHERLGVHVKDTYETGDGDEFCRDFAPIPDFVHACSENGNAFGGYDCTCGEPWLAGGCMSQPSARP